MIWSLIRQFVFQFTLPGRGATEAATDALHKQLISIHAPREGSDEEDFRC